MGTTGGFVGSVSMGPHLPAAANQARVFSSGTASRKVVPFPAGGIVSVPPSCRVRLPTTVGVRGVLPKFRN